MDNWDSVPDFFHETTWEEDEEDEEEFCSCRNDTRRWCLKVILEIVDDEANEMILKVRKSKRVINKYRKRIRRKIQKRIQDQIRNDY